MPEFASPNSSSWLIKCLQYCLFFFFFVSVAVLRIHGSVVFGLVRSNFVTGYSPDSLCPFLSQISISMTAMLKLVPLALLKSLQDCPDLAIQVLIGDI